MISLGILGSTRGTSMGAIIAAIAQKQLAANIALVASNQADAPILAQARQHQLTMQYLDPTGLTRSAYDQQLAKLFAQYDVDLLVLIGYMRILSADFIRVWKNKVINVHPSLLPLFAGKMDLAVHAAVLEAGLSETGCSVHYVTEEVDAGPILLQKKCVVLPGDTPQSLKQRVQVLEGEALVETLAMLANG